MIRQTGGRTPGLTSTSFEREFLGFVSLNFAEHFAVLIDDADRRNPNSIIHPWQIGLHGLSKLRSSDCGLLQKKVGRISRERISGDNSCLNSVVIFTMPEASDFETQSSGKGQRSTDDLHFLRLQNMFRK
jgi:hypothetical protein